MPEVDQFSDAVDIAGLTCKSDIRRTGMNFTHQALSPQFGQTRDAQAKLSYNKRVQQRHRL
jgi:hypothetical protein